MDTKETEAFHSMPFFGFHFCNEEVKNDGVFSVQSAFYSLLA